LASVFCLCAAADILERAMDRVCEPLPKRCEVFDFAREHAKRHGVIFVEFTEDRGT
jgi:hypothetical protein